MQDSESVLYKRGAALLPRCLVHCHRGQESATIVCATHEEAESACAASYQEGFRHHRVYDVSLSAARPWRPAVPPTLWERGCAHG